jgi:hypothetical protein
VQILSEEVKLLPPKRGDKADERCAFATVKPGNHALSENPKEDWCYGCDQYICVGCLSPKNAMEPTGFHNATDHQPGIYMVSVDP